MITEPLTRPAVVLNDACPDCGHHCRYIGETIHTPPARVFCCKAEIARFHALMADNAAGVVYKRPEGGAQ